MRCAGRRGPACGADGGRRGSHTPVVAPSPTSETTVKGNRRARVFTPRATFAALGPRHGPRLEARLVEVHETEVDALGDGPLGAHLREEVQSEELRGHDLALVEGLVLARHLAGEPAEGDLGL